ncbi:helix-turn-helix transcriptional regulator [Microvirga sp. 3-52]|uniref:helix-turn-helix domain-containing protein n=1 Tax=Microvirga sp. 3-52 TaxID=2792425 RepID=UPI001ACA711E|nr:helix-turn-helix transcriptional regulator [Microvirga sp. 3-52]MBO1906118.1 helix-turn-helix transcriptional regulator [Microvirga sp. 3-52]MBS7453290.1 helix-turn-helix transcriptional regulator [Microvirga sp. 3-52]
MKKSTGSIDKEIGSRVRMRRVSIGMSQEKLGDMLGLTFQQVQKYEKGMNRISVARLVEIAKILNVEIGFFFDGIKGGKSEPGFAESGAPPYVSDMMSTPEGLQLVRTFAGIKSPKVRKSIVQLVSALATQELATQEEAERSS